MKKFGLLLLGTISALVLLANVGPLIGLAITLVILYYVVKAFVKTESTFSKIVWAIIGCIVLSITVANVPSIIGLVAAYVLYVVYRKWNESGVSEEIGESRVVEENDPFTNFEKQWAELKQS